MNHRLVAAELRALADRTVSKNHESEFAKALYRRAATIIEIQTTRADQSRQTIANLVRYGLPDKGASKEAIVRSMVASFVKSEDALKRDNEAASGLDDDQTL